MAGRLFLAALIFLLTPASTFAAFSLEAVSPAEITSPGQELTLFVTATNLSTGTHYFQAAITKEGASNYFGFTQGSSGNWLEYSSSPNLSSLVAAVPSAGNWSGEIKAKINPADSGFSGNGPYLIKVLKYITSSGSSSNSIPVSINLAALPTPNQITPTTSSSQVVVTEEKKVPTARIFIPSNLMVGQDFDISFTLENFEPGPYFVKARMGIDSSHLTSGQTFNSEWLADTDSWSKFPQISGNSKLKARLSPIAAAGEYKLKVSFKRGDSSPLLSEEKTVQFVANPNPPQTGTATSPKTTPAKSPTSIQISKTAPIVLAAAASSASTQAMLDDHFKNVDLLGTISGKKTRGDSLNRPHDLLLSQTVNQSFPPEALIICLGFLLICGGVGWILKEKYLSQDE